MKILYPEESLNKTELILNSPDDTKAIELRDKAMLFALYATGMRISELVNSQAHLYAFQ